MKKNDGFTLLEVMISVAILGVIMTLIWSTTSQSLNAKDRTEKRDMVFHMGRVALRKISDDLTVAFLAKQIVQASAGSESTPASETAVSGPVKTFFIGEDQGAQDSVKFTSLSHLRLFKNAKESDQCKISYEVVPSGEDPKLVKLVRREDPWLDDSVEVKGKPLTLVEDIREFSMEYYDPRKNEWGKEWDSQKVDWRMRLPFAVRVKIVFPDPDDENAEIPLSTAVLIALSEDPIDL